MFIRVRFSFLLLFKITMLKEMNNMPEIVGAHKEFFPGAVVREDNFPAISMGIKNRGRVEGRNLYGFFVTNDEFFGKLSQIYCGDGFYEVHYLKYEKGEAIDLRPIIENPPKEMHDEFLRNVKEGAYCMGSDANVIKTLKKENIPVRKIMLWHRLGWKFGK